MNKKFWTISFIIVTVLIIAVYDIWVIRLMGNQESISAHILSMGEATPFIPLLLGFTFGHLTWPNKDSMVHGLKVNFLSYGFFLITSPLAIYDVYKLYLGDGNVLIDNYDVISIFPFVLGYCLGHILWPMKPEKWSGRFK